MKRIGCFGRWMVGALIASGACFADTIHTFTFSGDAGADFSGVITFTTGADDSGGLADVISSSASIGSVGQQISDNSGSHFVIIPAVSYLANELRSFAFVSGIPGACHFSATRDPNVVCHSLTADWVSPQGQLLDVLVEYAQGYTQTFAFYQAIPQQPSFRGGVSLFTVTTDVAGVSVTEPGALSLCMMGLGALAVYGTRHLRD